MATTEHIPIADGILEWARRTAGYDLPTAAKKLAITPERLQTWETNAAAPSMAKLRQISKLYKRPLAVLLLPEPPTEFSVLKDYRKLPDARQGAWSPALHAEYKRALMQREVFLELAELSPASLVESKLDATADLGDGAEAVAGLLRSLLGMDAWSRPVRMDPRSALNAAVDKVEGFGILVLQTQDVDISEMRGMSISEWPYPVVILNGSDWPRPRLFSLLHELTHLLLNASGICDLHEARRPEVDIDVLENFCNAVAAAAIMPKAEIDADAQIDASVQWTVDNLSAVANRYGASSESFLLRLITLQLADWKVYRDLKPELDRKYADARKAEKERRKTKKGGPSYYTVKARDLGPGYVHSVLDAFQSRAISSFDVVDYLDVKFHQLPKLREALR